MDEPSDSNDETDNELASPGRQDTGPGDDDAAAEEGRSSNDDEPADDDQPAAKRPRPRLISVYELRAAGALDVPPGWRKSLSAGCDRQQDRQRDLFSDLLDDDNPPPEEQQAAPSDADRDGSTESSKP